MESLKNRLQAENVYLQEEILTEHKFDEMVGQGRALVAVLQKVERVAGTDATVLVTGETGTGKELIARAVHGRSARTHRPLVKVNCGAVPASLIESELFGHVKGAFTGAIDRRIGRFELAERRDIVSRRGRRADARHAGQAAPRAAGAGIRAGRQQQDAASTSGSSRPPTATSPKKSAGRFRSDLFFRLNVVPLTVPPLRKRPEDIPLLVHYFVSRSAKKFGRKIDGVSRDTMDLLTRIDGPGNVRPVSSSIVSLETPSIFRPNFLAKRETK